MRPPNKKGLCKGLKPWKRPKPCLAPRYAATDRGVVEQFNAGDAFGQLLGAAAAVAAQHAEMPGADVAAMYIALAHFAGAVYPDRLDYIDRVLASCQEVGVTPVFTQSRHTLSSRALAQSDSSGVGSPACGDAAEQGL